MATGTAAGETTLPKDQSADRRSEMFPTEIATRNAEAKRTGKRRKRLPREGCLCPRCEAKRREERGR
jgi:hypothetical protein